MTSGWVRSELGPFRLDVSWEAASGKVLVLFGSSGSGKTVTLRCIAGLHTPREGHIDIGGTTVFDHKLHINVAPHHRRVGYVPQDLLLFPHLDVAGNVGYGLRGQSTESRRKRVDGLLAGIGLEGFGTRRPWELSGGQQQRVALARALAPGPSILLLDEPFSALDMDTRRQVRAEVHEALRGAQIPVVLVTHDREDAFAMGDQVLVLDGGTTIASGVPVEVLGHPPRERVARLMGVENLLRLRVDQVAPSEGTMTGSGGQFVLEVPLSDARVGDEVTVGLRADDILLASSAPAGLSARNVLPGNVVRVEPAGALWQVTVDCGVMIRSHVTLGAVANLGIVPGAKVWVVIKASSCVVMR